MKLTQTQQNIIDFINESNGVTYKEIIAAIYGEYTNKRYACLKVMICNARKALRSLGTDIVDSGHDKRPVVFYPSSVRIG